MKQSRLGVVIVLVALVAGGLWWWRTHRASTTPPVTANHAGAVATRAAAGTPSVAGPAHVIVTVTDAKGALAGATVRIARKAGAGDVELAQTGADGVASLDVDAGSWTASASAPGHRPAALAARELAAGATVRLALVLDGGGRKLAGTVTDATGGAIAGARVDAASVAGVHASAAVATTQTTTDGHYELTVAEGQLLVAVNHPDYAAQSRYVEVPPAGATADFQLVPGGVIEGVVRDADTHEPVAAALVEAGRDRSGNTVFGEAARRHATAGPDGRFRITGLRPGAYELSARAGERYSRAPTLVGLGVAEQVADVAILVGKGVVVRGIVVDDAGAPAAGVDVSSFGGERDYGTDAPSDAKGAFAIAGIAPGHYALMGEGATYVPAGGTPIDVGTADLAGVRVTVRRASLVKGHVEPRQVCEVRLDFAEGMLGPREMPMLVSPQTTGADGEFSLGPASPIPYILAARCPSGAKGSSPVKVTADLAPVTIEVTAGASIAGHVVDGSGAPVANATVMATADATSERTTIVNGLVTSGAQTLSGSDGAFELVGLEAATYRLHVLDRGRPVPTKHDVKVALAERQHETGVEVAIDRPDGTISGTVIGADGAPIADAWVSVQQTFEDLADAVGHGDTGFRTIMVQNNGDGADAGAIPPALTDASGHFAITGLPRVPWTVVAEAQGGRARGRVAKVTPDATISITAATITALTGTVHAAGAPPATFDVELDGPTHTKRTFAWSGNGASGGSAAGADGAFQFPRVDPGSYVVSVTSSAGNGQAQVTVGDTTSVDITLVANAVVVGKTVDASGKPVPGTPIAVVPDDGTGRLKLSLEGMPPTSGPDGTFRIEAKAGPIYVVALAGPKPIDKRVVLQAGQTLDVGALVVPAAAP